MDCMHWINTLGLSTSVQPIIISLLFTEALHKVTGPWWWWWWITSAANCLWILTLVFQFRMSATEAGFDAYSMQEINPNRRRRPVDSIEQTNNRFILKPAPYSVSPHHQIKMKPPQFSPFLHWHLHSLRFYVIKTEPGVPIWQPITCFLLMIMVKLFTNRWNQPCNNNGISQLRIAAQLCVLGETGYFTLRMAPHWQRVRK